MSTDYVPLTAEEEAREIADFEAWARTPEALALWDKLLAEHQPEMDALDRMHNLDWRLLLEPMTV